LGLALSAVVLVPTTAGASRGGAGYQVLCNRADYGCVEGTGYHGQSRWGANYFRAGHNCTSYVSFRIAQLGVAQPWRPMGDGGEWNERGARAGYLNDGSPAAGAVAVWEAHSRMSPGGSGHVAYVERVDGDTIELTDDSTGGGTRRMLITRGSAYWPASFVHIKDLIDPLAVGDRVLGGIRAAVSMSGGALNVIGGDPWILGVLRLHSVT
jgi:surface antigen